ncbi:MAG: tetratricopeptide repeat protein [Nitrospirae bacterium]|nr:tetratricopeptide repeat protein [Nitrospirota bacterium]MBF0534675.1 tetratricopeptide repeat protein [Nitrospirota bacterium]MBF0616281.1 tetratricopeptide repeat protein [Nitrospirota bacterium]
MKDFLKKITTGSSGDIITAAIFIIVLTVFVFIEVRGFDFVNLDDTKYIFENQRVIHGLTLDNVLWAFKTTYSFYWQPLTWLTHMLDIEMYGLNAGGHHITNLIIHILNSILLFYAFYLINADMLRSGALAALFALHPMHVESVAWIAERKDVLTAFFYIAAVALYFSYAKKPSLRKYIYVAIAFVLSIMSKPMAVTLPVSLLLLDVWPCGRFKFEGSIAQFLKFNKALFYEKIPFFVISVITAIVTFFAQKEVGAVASLENLPVSLRLENALVSYVKYVYKLFYPVELACLYPLPRTIPLLQPVLALLALVVVSAIAVLTIKKAPYIFAGWFWFVITMLPVIGLVQVGNQSMADRFTYIPYIGLFAIVVTAIPEPKTNAKKALASALAFIVLLFCVVLSKKQVSFWQNSVTLFKHTLAVTKDNVVILNNLGASLISMGRSDEAVGYFKQAVEINPIYVEANVNYANALVRLRQADNSILYYNIALKLKPNIPEAYNGLGTAMIVKGNKDEAARYFKKAIQLRPGYEDALFNLRLIERGVK